MNEYQDEWIEAVPAAYYLEDDKPGKVYRASTTGPPLKVKECSNWDYGDSIVIEYEDIEKRAMKEMFRPETDTTTRISIKPMDARFLVVALIDALSGGGDPIADKLMKVIEEEYDKRADELGGNSE